MTAPSVRWLALAVLLGTGVSARAEPVTVYRCTDDQGHVTLRDTPCPRGQQQTTREMLRPRDPPPRAAVSAPTPPPAPPPAAPAPTRVVIVQAPRTVYECVTPYGERYTSENAEGNPRWVPLWTLGFPVRTFGPRAHPGGVNGHVKFGGGDVRGRVDIGTPVPRPPMQRPPPSQPPSHSPPLLTFPAYTWIRDPCSPLPQEEVCSRMSDRRYALIRRYNSALPSERTRIVEEQRVIDARLAQDCRDY